MNIQPSQEVLNALTKALQDALIQAQPTATGGNDSSSSTDVQQTVTRETTIGSIPATVTFTPKVSERAPAPAPAKTVLIPTRAKPCYKCSCCCGTYETCACCGYSVERECSDWESCCKSLGMDFWVNVEMCASIGETLDFRRAQKCGCETYTPYCRYCCKIACFPATVIGAILNAIGKCCACWCNDCWDDYTCPCGS